MTWTIKFDERAVKELKKIDRKVQQDIFHYLHKRIETDEDPRRFGKALSSELKGLWRYRIGDYRIVCEIQDHVLTVLVVRVAHRRKVYC